MSSVTIRTLPYSRTTLSIEKLKDENIENAYDVIKDAARRGDNMGVDEIPTLDYFKFLLKYYSAWTLSDISSGAIVGLLTMGSCRISRSRHATVAQALIITSEGLSRKIIFREMAEMACEFAVAMGVGYSACVLEVFSTCSEHIMAYREAGFVITCVIPTAGKLAGKPGHVNSYIMYKDLCLGNVPMPFNDDSNKYDDLKNFIPTLRVSPAPLPVNYRTHTGLEVIVRHLKLDEVQLFYDTLKEAAASGTGYGFDELPNLQFFSRFYVHDYYNFVIEERGSGKIVAFQNFGPSVFRRSPENSVLSDGNNVMLPEFRGKKLSEEFMDIQTAIAIDCGFTCMIGETSALNLPSLAGMSGIGAINTGSIPKCIFFKNVGWVDLITICKPYSKHNKSLKEILFPAKV